MGVSKQACWLAAEAGHCVPQRLTISPPLRLGTQMCLYALPKVLNTLARNGGRALTLVEAKCKCPAPALSIVLPVRGTRYCLMCLYGVSCSFRCPSNCLYIALC